MTPKGLLLLLILTVFFLLICLSSIFERNADTSRDEETLFGQKLTLPIPR